MFRKKNEKWLSWEEFLQLAEYQEKIRKILEVEDDRLGKTD